jgi:fumarylacetoacetase
VKKGEQLLHFPFLFDCSFLCTNPKMPSWITVDAESHFPIQNLPFGVFSHSGRGLAPRCATVIGNTVIDLSALHAAGLFSDISEIASRNVFADGSLNAFMSNTRAVWRAVRGRLAALFAEDSEDRRVRDNQELQAQAFVPLSEVTMHLPAQVSEYTDFYSSREHATNVGIMFRGIENALQPNWLHLPVGYHGRASSVVVSGTPVIRPCGQVQKDQANPKAGSNFVACRALDFELEMGAFLGGPANTLGTPIDIKEAEDRIFGVVLLNDWSARDIQAWEYVPLGPFTAKNFCTSISPWIVTLDALEPFRCHSSAGPEQNDPVPLPYLIDPEYHRGTYDVKLQVSVAAPEDTEASVITESNFKYLYWNMRQQLVHHSVTGASMRPGDLLGSGTISGPAEGTFGSMLELSWKGAKEIPLNKTQSANAIRKYLLDGDTCTMTGYAESADGYRVGFGQVSGKILPANHPYLGK